MSGLLFSYAALLIVAFQLVLTRLLAASSGFRMILASGILLVRRLRMPEPIG